MEVEFVRKISSFPAWLESLHPYVRAALVFISGAIMVPAMPPWNAWPVLAAGFLLFYPLLCCAKSRTSAFLYGWLWGFGYFLFGLSWIGNALLVDGSEFKWAWPLAVAGLPFMLSFFPACAALAFYHVPGRNRACGFFAFITLLLLSEYARGHLFTGFPWNLFGYTWSSLLQVAQLAALGGIYWLTLLTVFWMALPGFLLVSQDSAPVKILLALAAVITLCASITLGTFYLGHHPTVLDNRIAVRVVQPNIPQEEKWDSRKAAENLEKLLILSYPEDVNKYMTTILVWPETAISDFTMAAPAAQQAVRTALSQYESPAFLLTGYLRHEPNDVNDKNDDDFFNSIVAFDKGFRPLVNYDKAHLVPFGEYIPFQKWIPIGPVVQFAGFNPGPGPRSLAVSGIGTLSLLVCYEIIFPGAITEKGAPRPDWIVNVTNDAWYGDTAGPRQHFVMAQFRAIEEGIPVIRSANTGISGVIDPQGRIISQTALMQEKGINVALPQKLEGSTPYGEYGDIVFWITIISNILIAFCFHRCMDRRGLK